MTSTKIVMIHGRGQAADPQTASDSVELRAFIDSKKRQFLAGLAKGLVLANCPLIEETDTIFPFYGNVFQKAIDDYEHGGGTPPHLEAADPGTPVEKSQGGDPDDIRELSTMQAEMLKDMAARLDFNAQREVRYQGTNEEFRPSDALGVPFVTGALQFLSRKTGVPAAIIRGHLSDVAYYIGMDNMRETVLNVVRKEVDKLPPDDDLIVVSHSLGTIVAYDLLADPENKLGGRKVKLFVTAGSPLGLKLVAARLLGKVSGRPPTAPRTIPKKAGSWINAYDVLDIVALIHPLAPEFTQEVKGQLVDERTFNPTGPHAIIDYLSDPDVAGPISRAMTTG
jgi:hypothetical protein